MSTTKTTYYVATPGGEPLFGCSSAASGRKELKNLESGGQCLVLVKETTVTKTEKVS